MPEFEEGVVTALEELRGSVEDVESAIERKSFLSPAASFLFSFFVGVVFVVLGLSLFDDIRDSRWYIGLTHGLMPSRVDIAEIAFNECAFWAAPIGAKPCYYKRQIATLRWAKNDAGYPIQSFDEGKTWTQFSSPPGEWVPATNTVEHVYVSWIKIDRR